MPQSSELVTGRPSSHKFGRGGNPAEAGPFIGVVVNNVDPTRQGRLQVVIQEQNDTKKDGRPNLSDKSQWRTVSYAPPFYGGTPKADAKQGSSSDVGQYPDGTTTTYGMWFAPPDIGNRVLCFFVAGDPTRGFYVACIPEEQSNHMVPAIAGAPEKERQASNGSQSGYLSDSPLLPVTEINTNNKKIADSTKFYDEKKPVHSQSAGILFQQGLDKDPVRGPTTSSSQRESPSNCFGISSPGRAIYQGGDKNKGTTEAKTMSKTDPDQSKARVIARRSGHTFVLDDGDQDGKNNMIKIRSSQGHQITMSDDMNCLYIVHGNGQTWIELGQEGTVDVFSTNSVNVRTQGTLNLHADQDINIFAGNKLSIKSMKGTTVQSETTLDLACKGQFLQYSDKKIGIKSGSGIDIQSKIIGIGGGSKVNVVAKQINLNSGGKVNVPSPKGLIEYKCPDTEFQSSTGWQPKENKLTSICSRVPTHEPYPYHNQGVKTGKSAEKGKPGGAPGAPGMGKGWSVKKK